MMTDKHELLTQLQDQIAIWKSEMKILEAKAEGATVEAKAQCREALDALRSQCEAGEATLDEWKDKAEDAWDSFQAEAEESLAAVKVSVTDSIDRVKAFFA
jgi:hypothetical protein